MEEILFRICVAKRFTIESWNHKLAPTMYYGFVSSCLISMILGLILMFIFSLECGYVVGLNFDPKSLCNCGMSRLYDAYICSVSTWCD